MKADALLVKLNSCSTNIIFIAMHLQIKLPKTLGKEKKIRYIPVSVLPD